MMLNRRELISALGLLGFSTAFGQSFADNLALPLIQKPIPTSKELLPVIGIGTSRTFDKESTQKNLNQFLPVLEAFFSNGGTLIDSSAMYGKAERFSGDLIRHMPAKPKPFFATKVWTTGKQEGIVQMKRSFERLGAKTIDLMQIHNLKDWEV
ncbi:MAG: aldo/keto reductase, partial [Pseudomonadota bacterium]